VRAIRTAEIIAVGSEMIGIAVRAKAVVGDSTDDLASILGSALSRSDLIVLTGGLGPTDDDVTRDAVARVLGRPLHEDAAILERLRARFAARGLDMPPLNRRQAMVPENAEVLHNPHGTAPGLWIEHAGHILVLLPGPPGELKPMVDVLIRERLVLRAEGMRLLTRIVRVAGRTESHVEMAAQPLYERWREKSRSIEVTILAAPGTIDLHLTVRVRDVALGAAVLDAAVGDLREVFADDLYSANGQPMEEVLGGMLREGRHTIAVAESCTGGLLSSRLTDVPGSSVYLDRAVVAYSNEAKIAWLGVGADLIAAHGAVSEPVAEAMAAGIRARADTTIGVAVTGIAGPGGGTPEKPVGTVAIAVEGPWGRSVRTRRFSGHREQVKWHASSAAMDDVRRAILRAGRAG
jgi:nicotinamide-nucleotide amidase